MKYIKVAVVVLGSIALLFMVAAKFSAVESRYKCAGSFAEGEQRESLTVFLKLFEYRWWVGLWSDSDGAAWVEVPNRWTEYFPSVLEVGDQLQFGESPELPVGAFSTLSGALAVALPVGHFDGMCNEVEGPG